MQLKELSELATVEYTITKIIKASDDQTWYKIGDRKILMSCQATVKAGIDLSQLKAEDVSINGDEITLTLPRATIQSLNIKPEDIRTEFQEVGLFRSDFTAAERNQLMAQGEARSEKIWHPRISCVRQNQMHPFLLASFSGSWDIRK